MSLFRPKEKILRFNYFVPKQYKDRGFKAVFLDIDNTITLPDVGDFNIEAKMFVDDIKSCGMIPVIFSNNNKNRVKEFVDDYDVKWTYHSYKPLPFGFWLECMKLKVKPSEVIVIGDQLLTDVLGANLSGCYGIYSKPLSKTDIPVTARNRKIERFIWRHILHEEV